MSVVAKKRYKHVHIVIPYDEWKSIKQELLERDEQLTPLIRRLLLSILPKSGKEVDRQAPNARQ
jgi:hypothetical protein